MGYKDPARQAAYQREWMRARRKAFFDGKSCEWCGSTSQLELDHINPSEKTTHNIWSWAKRRREAELAKCQVLCNSCHKKKTYSHRPRKAQHGGAGMYRRGCRCVLCVEWNRNRNRAWRERQKQAA